MLLFYCSLVHWLIVHSRWGYKNWTELADVVENFKNYGIPLETVWTDIDYMNQYRDFENDQNTFNYTEGAQFLSNLHSTYQHYVPIVDSAIYVPNPLNASDDYPSFTRGNDSGVFILNADGSLYIGAVWPGHVANSFHASPVLTKPVLPHSLTGVLPELKSGGRKK